MSQDTNIQISLHRENLSPAQLSASDLAELLKKLESFILEETFYQNPQIMSEQEVFISLVAVQSGSINLVLQPNHPAIMPVVSEITGAIYHNRLDILSVEGYNRLRDLRNWLKKPQLHLRIHYNTQTAEISPVLNLEEPIMIASPSILYGELLQIGGKNPKARLILSNRKGITCHFDKSQGKALIKQLANKIYSWVGLRGVAYLNPKDLSVRSFRVEGITDFEDYPADQNIALLKELLAPYYQDVVNPDDYVHDLRDENWG